MLANSGSGKPRETTKCSDEFNTNAIHTERFSSASWGVVVKASDLLAAAAKPYRLEVIAPDVGAAVHHAGGLIFDRAVSGWRVAVILPQCADPRALNILGAEYLRFDKACSIDPTPPPDALIACAKLRRDDEQICERLDWAAASMRSDVAVWTDETTICAAETTIRAVHHQLSRAARAFKVQAQAALRTSPSAHTVEVFWSLVKTPLSVSTEKVTLRESPLVG